MAWDLPLCLFLYKRWKSIIKDIFHHLILWIIYDFFQHTSTNAQIWLFPGPVPETLTFYRTIQADFYLCIDHCRFNLLMKYNSTARVCFLHLDYNNTHKEHSLDSGVVILFYCVVHKDWGWWRHCLNLISQLREQSNGRNWTLLNWTEAELVLPWRL